VQISPFGKRAVDNRLSSAILTIMSKRDNDEGPLSGAWQSRFHSFLVRKRLVPGGKAKYFVGWVGDGRKRGHH